MLVHEVINETQVKNSSVKKKNAFNFAAQ